MIHQKCISAWKDHEKRLDNSNSFIHLEVPPVIPTLKFVDDKVPRSTKDRFSIPNTIDFDLVQNLRHQWSIDFQMNHLHSTFTILRHLSELTMLSGVHRCQAALKSVLLDNLTEPIK